jgi:hypothetical protein
LASGACRRIRTGRPLRLTEVSTPASERTRAWRRLPDVRACEGIRSSPNRRNATPYWKLLAPLILEAIGEALYQQIVTEIAALLAGLRDDPREPASAQCAAQVVLSTSSIT